MKLTKKQLIRVIRESLLNELSPDFAVDHSVGQATVKTMELDSKEFMDGIKTVGDISANVVYEILANLPVSGTLISAAETADEVWEISQIIKEKEQEQAIQKFVETKLIDKAAASIPAGRLLSKVLPASLKRKFSRAAIPDDVKEHLTALIKYLVVLVQGKTEKEAKKIIKMGLEKGKKQG